MRIASTTPLVGEIKCWASHHPGSRFRRFREVSQRELHDQQHGQGQAGQRDGVGLRQTPAEGEEGQRGRRC